MRYILSIGALALAASMATQANPWDVAPKAVPYKNVADAVKATSEPGKPSALNPSCAGMTGDACTKEAKRLDKPQPKQLEASNPPVEPRE